MIPIYVWKGFSIITPKRKDCPTNFLTETKREKLEENSRNLKPSSARRPSLFNEDNLNEKSKSATWYVGWSWWTIRASLASSNSTIIRLLLSPPCIQEWSVIFFVPKMKELLGLIFLFLFNYTVKRFIYGSLDLWCWPIVVLICKVRLWRSNRSWSGAFMEVFVASLSSLRDNIVCFALRSSIAMDLVFILVCK